MNAPPIRASASPLHNWNLGESIRSIQYDEQADCLYALGGTSLYRKDAHEQDFRKVRTIAAPGRNQQRACYSFCSHGDIVCVTLIGLDAAIVNAAWIGDINATAGGHIETHFSGLMTMFAQSEHNACFDEHGTLYVASPATVLYSTDLGRTWRPHGYINQELAFAQSAFGVKVQSIKVNYPGRTAAFVGTTSGALCLYEGDDSFDTIAYVDATVQSTVNYSYDTKGDYLVSWLYDPTAQPQTLYTVNMRMFQAKNDDPEFKLGPGPRVNAPQYAIDPRVTALAVSSTTSYTGPNFYLAVPAPAGMVSSDGPAGTDLRQVLFFIGQANQDPGIETGDGFPAYIAPLALNCMHQHQERLYIGTGTGILEYLESDIMPATPAS
ncbi:Exo-alpha-sialidase [Bordetella sputigena]|uniref:hypothetical protein n=1 Tax=Bordetella sputigena TaxID=1416810 RepID=UPI0039F025CB